MLLGEDIVCFTFRPWNSTWKTDQQVMSRLAGSNRVLYVNPPRGLRDAARELVRPALHRPVLERVGANLFVYNEPLLLAGWGRDHVLSRVFNWVTDTARMRHVRYLVDRLGFRSPILWLYSSLAASALGSFGEKLVVYCVIDNYEQYYSTHLRFWRARVSQGHFETLRRADLVFAVSPLLYERCLRYNQRSFLVPNGVSYELFQVAMHSGVTPPEAQSIPHPIIGYVGVVHSVLDLALLERVSVEHPEWSLMIVGPVDSLAPDDRRVWARLVAYPNVYYLGGKAPESLPLYINSCDVALMPYRVGPLTQYIDSLKLYEYLACGTPVVSTNLPSARRFDALIEIAEEAASFVNAIERALLDPPDRRDARRSAAQEHSWESRIALMSDIVLRCLDRPSDRSAMLDGGQRSLRE